jgi:AraC-like DNA-binding protein
LRDTVVCFWNRAGSGASSGGTAILPDGCIDIIWVGEQPPFVAGPMTVAVASDVASGAEVIGVRFRPGVAPAILGIGARELRDRRISCADVWVGDLALAWADVPARETLGDRLAALDEVITGRLGQVPPPDEAVVRAARWLGYDPAARPAALVQRTGLSERQVRRRFDEAIGYGPKTLQRILRLQRLIWLASQPTKGAPSLSRLAFAAGYADQPHMTREVAALTAATPGQLLRAGQAHSAVADLFKT